MSQINDMDGKRDIDVDVEIENVKSNRTFSTILKFHTIKRVAIKLAHLSIYFLG